MIEIRRKENTTLEKIKEDSVEYDIVFFDTVSKIEFIVDCNLKMGDQLTVQELSMVIIKLINKNNLLKERLTKIEDELKL